MKVHDLSRGKFITIVCGALVLLLLLAFLSYFYVIPMVSSEVGDADLSEAVVIRSEEMNATSSIDMLRKDIEALLTEEDEGQGDQDE